MNSRRFGQHESGVSVSARNLVFSYGAKTVLDGACFTLDSSRRSCLVGKNGAGKSTLLRILARELKPEGGELVTSNPCYTAVYVPQVIPHLPSDISALDFLLPRPAQQTAPAGAPPPAARPPRTPGTNGYAEDLWDSENLDSARARATKDLSSFVGLRRGEQDTPLRALSGGQKTRLFILR
ncbi:MAG: ATP-binding cassette domain-containing protein, partial [Anaerolineae bacterium]|nr:ATP-binding cassette domain-containing protein [Anaerolineae bacterium]